jgi:opacity protein-like surface antigen
VIRSPRLLAALTCAAAVVATLVVDSSSASAQRIRIRARARAHVHIGGHGHVVVRPYQGPYVRVRPRYYWGWGVRFATPPPPPPPCYYGCATVSAYYTAPAPAVTVAAPAPLPPPVPTFGIGVFAGPVDVEGNEYGTDLGLVGRLRLSNHFRLEGELSKTDIEDGARIDRRVGGALLYDFNPYGRFAPYILGGLGVGRAEMDGRYGANQGYAEVGVGLEWRIASRFSLIGDIRAGQRENRMDDDVEIQPLLQPAPEASMDETENYTRGRLGAILYF